MKSLECSQMTQVCAGTNVFREAYNNTSFPSWEAPLAITLLSIAEHYLNNRPFIDHLGCHLILPISVCAAALSISYSKNLIYAMMAETEE
ncbi:MAG: hypothetical protein U1E78_11465 [Gammaproteobacteria bacterium]